ncbi:MAG: transcription antitermination factor NusB [Bacteroidales bacterium]|nr:transcription antitermination factor NusB [Bacteroidales bacterium]
MINRLLIRIKTAQLVYAYMQGSMDRLTCDDQLANSLEAGYELYNYLLALIVKVTDYRRMQLETGKKKFMPSLEERRPNTRFADNRVAVMIAEKSHVLEYCEEHKLLNDFDTEMYRSLLDQIMETEAYKRFMAQAEPPTFEDEKTLWKEIFQQVINNNIKLDEALEEKRLYWNDDLATITEFVIKAINKLKEDAEEVKLAPMFSREDDRKFAMELFHHAIDEAQEYEALIGKNASNWHIDRMPLMDKVIMITALAEIKNFFDIPTRISMNEYIELAKHYCALDTARFVNGILDKIVKEWKKEGVITKA